MERETAVMSLVGLSPPPEISASGTIPWTNADRVDALNARPGKPNDPGDPGCPLCLGEGTVYYLNGDDIYSRDCVCREKRKSRDRWKESGLGELYERYTLARYRTDIDWQVLIRDKAEEYLKKKEGWLYICGTSGSGKTHILYAIARELIEAGYETRCFKWRTDAVFLKAGVNEADYGKKLRAFTDCRVLLIDDFWKGSVSEGDKNLAYAILNERYNAPSRLTLISSEREINEILNIDQAIGSRIVERAKGFLLRTGNVNLRLKM